MALSDLQRLRLKIADRPRAIINETLGLGDGVLAAFQAQLYPIVDESDVLLLRTGDTGVVLVRGQDYTTDYDSGVFTLTSAPDNGAIVIAAYHWTTFSDEELYVLLDTLGDVTRAAMEAVRWLLADTDRFIKYTFGQERVDRSEARQALLNLLAEWRRGGRPTVLRATTDAQEEAMSPFIEQSGALDDDLQGDWNE